MYYCWSYNSNNNSKLNVSHLSFDYINQKDNINDVVSSSELIVKGKVTKITPIEVHKLIFTDYEIDVSDVLKGEKQSVVVRLTGGTLGDTEIIADGIEPLVEDQEYLLCLHRVFPKDASSNLFCPVGGFQGIFQVDESATEESTTGGSVKISNTKNDKFKIKKFNKSNKIETDIIGKEFDKKDFE